MPGNQHGERDTRRRRTLFWVVAIAATALVFDGYDLVVYGTVVPTLLRDPSQLGAISPEQAGAPGSYALIGVMVGALTAGFIGDYIGRRKVLLVNIAWFSLGMGATAMTTSIAAFGLFRFLTGIGVGALVATAGAMVAEFAPAGRRNLLNALVYSGVPAGGVLAALVAIALSDLIGWRGLFWVGGLPIVLLLPLAAVKLPESPRWLLARGRGEAAEHISRRTGVLLPTHETLAAPTGTTANVGFAALVTRRYAGGTVLLGLMSFSGLLLTYGLNTWLPEIMGQNGLGTGYALLFLLTLNLGAILGGVVASRAADRVGPQRVVATTFGLAALTLLLLPLGLPLPILLLGVAVAGVGTIGTQVLIYGFVSNYYETVARAAGVAWCAGFGRLGGILGPIIGGSLIGAGVGGRVAFYIFAGIAVAGAMVTFLVPKSAAAGGLPGTDVSHGAAVPAAVPATTVAG
jgi:AAHS family benzoate transporter-like MFS transporter